MEPSLNISAEDAENVCKFSKAVASVYASNFEPNPFRSSLDIYNVDVATAKNAAKKFLLYYHPDKNGNDNNLAGTYSDNSEHVLIIQKSNIVGGNLSDLVKDVAFAKYADPNGKDPRGVVYMEPFISSYDDAMTHWENVMELGGDTADARLLREKAKQQKDEEMQRFLRAKDVEECVEKIYNPKVVHSHVVIDSHVVSEPQVVIEPQVSGPASRQRKRSRKVVDAQVVEPDGVSERPASRRQRKCPCKIVEPQVAEPQVADLQGTSKCPRWMQEADSSVLTRSYETAFRNLKKEAVFKDTTTSFLQFFIDYEDYSLDQMKALRTTNPEKFWLSGKECHKWTYAQKYHKNSNHLYVCCLQKIFEWSV